jgi:hypothetical protein
MGLLHLNPSVTIYKELTEETPIEITPGKSAVISALLLPKSQRELLTDKPLPQLKTLTFLHLFTHFRTPQRSIYYTFILHKTNFATLPPPTKTKSPNFASFDHTDNILLCPEY